MIQIQRFVNELMTSNCFVVWDDDSRHCVIIDPASKKAEREIQLIEDNKVVINKEESAKERFIQMIAIYKGNPKSMAVAPLMDAYKNGTLKSLGIDFEP